MMVDKQVAQAPNSNAKIRLVDKDVDLGTCD